jgi:hypothetical protein
MRASGPGGGPALAGTGLQPWPLRLGMGMGMGVGEMAGPHPREGRGAEQGEGGPWRAGRDEGECACDTEVTQKNEKSGESYCRNVQLTAGTCGNLDCHSAL